MDGNIIIHLITILFQEKSEKNPIFWSLVIGFQTRRLNLFNNDIFADNLQTYISNEMCVKKNRVAWRP